jgi:glycogen synthase
MRILVLTNFFPPKHLGGLELRCQEVVEYLQKRKHQVHVLTSRHGVERELPSKENVTRSLYLESNIHHYRPLDFFLKRPWQEYANRRIFLKILADFQPDVIFIWGMWNLSWRLAYWAEQWMPERVAYNIGSYWPLDADSHTTYWSNPSGNHITRLLLAPVSQLALSILKIEQYPPPLKFENVSCCSQFVVDILTKSGTVTSNAITILNGIDTSPFLKASKQKRSSEDGLRLVYFGSLVKHKGVHTAIEALRILQQKNRGFNNISLTIIGQGHPEYESYLSKLTNSMGLEENVQFVGLVPRTKLPEILSEYDVFLFTSIWDEPFGRTVIEAMASGLVVIGANVGGSREIFNFYPENTTYEPGNAQQLACQIERLIDNPELMRKLELAGPEIVQQHFTLTRMVDEIEEWLYTLKP